VRRLQAADGAIGLNKADGNNIATLRRVPQVSKLVDQIDRTVVVSRFHADARDPDGQQDKFEKPPEKPAPRPPRAGASLSGCAPNIARRTHERESGLLTGV